MASIPYAPFHWPPHGEICCTPEQAWQWVNAVAELALAGDNDGLNALPNCVAHYLDALRQAGVPR